MSDQIVRIDELPDAVKKEIDDMNQEVIEKCNEAAQKAAADAVKELKSTSPVRSDGFKRKYPPGYYARNWSKRMEQLENGVQGWTVFNHNHQITHLVEYGHIDSKTGRRIDGHAHIDPANEHASQEFVEQVENMKL